jgi:hypothetical protein
LAEVCNLLSAKGAHALLEGEVMGVQLLEHRPNVLEVLCPGRVVDEDVAEEHQDEAAEEGTKHVVHHCLECGWHVGEPEPHDQELKVSMVGVKRCLADICEVVGTAEFIEELVDNRYREFVLHCLGVKGAIVDAKAPSLVLLDEEHL